MKGSVTGSSKASDEDEEPVRELVKPAKNSRSPRITKGSDQIKELCTSNGINYDKLKKGSAKTVKKLEMFFSGFPRICGMELFPALQSLCLIGQEVEELENLETLVNLTELFVCECAVKKITGLEKCVNLKKLFLYDNKITRIENLSNLTKLTTLWLNNNDITELEGLENLTLLTNLNLASNRISAIGNSLNHNSNLEVLDLSANNLGSFKDLTNLTKLKNLTSLSLKNPVYGPNPVALLCNYSTHLLFHLPNLKRLDSYDVEAKQLKEMAEMTVMKKKMYYNMRIKTLQRNTADLQHKLTNEKYNLQAFAHARIQALYSCIKEIEREQEEMHMAPLRETKQSSDEESEKEKGEKVKEEDNSDELNKKFEIKKEALKTRIKKWDKQCQEIESCYRESWEQVQLVSDMTIQRLLVELDTGGNVRFEDGKPTDIWYKSCHDLVTSRFCAGDYLNYGVTGIKVHRITRVHNRILRARFDEALDQILAKSHIAEITKGRSHKKLLEYLFFMWNPDAFDEANEPIRVLEKGFRKSIEYQRAGFDGGVPLSNSVGICDQSRIQKCTARSKERGIANPFPFRHGQLIISKAFVGRAVSANTGEMRVTKGGYPYADSVFRLRTHEASKTGITKPAKSCDCSSRQCEWFIFDHEMVLPEYVVDFEYLTRHKSKSPYIHYFGDTVHSSSSSDSGQNEDYVDVDVLNMEPKSKPRPRLIGLTEEILLSHCNVQSLEHITVLNLHGNGLNRLKHLNSIPLLKKLIVSFNELAKLDDINHMSFLEYLDVSFNKVTTLEGLKGCNRLRYLNISWNKLKFIREELGIMRKHMITLVTLDTRNNPWQKPETLRTRALGRLKNLEVLDDIPVTDDEVALALRMAAASRISTFAILAHSRTDQVKPRTLSTVPTAQTILATSNQKPARPMDDDNQWMIKVTTLNLDNMRLGKISNLEKLVNLRWASFNDNDLTKIEGFEHCGMLEELSLEGNCISKFEGLVRNPKLQWLNLRNNNLVTLDTGMLERLPELKYFSIENNFIMSLRGLQHSVNLQELYIGNNEIANTREIFTLKAISTLVILDLCGNPLVENTTNYRLFVVYHLTTLKALDGLAVEPSEGGVAKDTFGGRMTTDFVAERLGHSNFGELRELDFPNCSLRTVDLGSGEQFMNLRSVNLEHNSLTSFGGLINLMHLKVLCLNHNHIESITPKSKALSPATVAKRGGDSTSDITNPENYTPVLVHLEVLHLGYNGISNMAALQLSRLPNLKALFLQGNEIVKVEGLEGLQELRELVLDRNKIKGLSEYSFINQWNLVELHMEENRIRDLNHIESLQNLQRLYVGMNRIQDFTELEKLESLSNLIELSVINNAITRRLLHRPMLVFRMPSLLCIDGIPVSPEERTKAEIYFLEQQGLQSNGVTMEAALPGIVNTRQSQAPLRVTTMHLSNNDRNWSGSTRQDHINGHVSVNGDSRDPNKGQRRATNQRGPSSGPVQTINPYQSADSYSHINSDRQLRSHSNSNVTNAQSFSRQPGGSNSISYIPHGFTYPNYPYSNGGDARTRKE